MRKLIFAYIIVNAMLGANIAYNSHKDPYKSQYSRCIEWAGEGYNKHCAKAE
jgi:hypothetical protein